VLTSASVSEVKYDIPIFICEPIDSLVLMVKSKITVSSPSISHSSILIRLFAIGRGLTTRSKEVI
jgi:hypothetical protein